MSDAIWDYYTECPVATAGFTLELDYSSNDTVNPGASQDTFSSAISANVSFTRKQLKTAYADGKFFGDNTVLLTADDALSNLADNEFFFVSNTRNNCDWNIILKVPTTATNYGSRSVNLHGGASGTAQIHMNPSFSLLSAFHSRTVHNNTYPPAPPGIFVINGPQATYSVGPIFTAFPTDPTLTYDNGFYFDALAFGGPPATAAPQVFNFNELDPPPPATGITRAPIVELSSPWLADFGGAYVDSISWSRTVIRGGITINGSGSFTWTLTAA